MGDAHPMRWSLIVTSFLVICAHTKLARRDKKEFHTNSVAERRRRRFAGKPSFHRHKYCLTRFPSSPPFKRSINFLHDCGQVFINLMRSTCGKGDTVARSHLRLHQPWHSLPETGANKD